MGNVVLDLVQFSHGGRAFGNRLDLAEVLVQPEVEVACVARIAEHEAGCPLHGLAADGGLDSAAFPNDFHPPVIAGEHGALDGRHGDIKLALGVLPIDQKRTGQPNRHLCHAKQVLDVAGHGLRVERKLACVMQAGWRLFFDKGLSFGDDVSAVVVLVGARDLAVAHGGVLGKAARVEKRGWRRKQRLRPCPALWPISPCGVAGVRR